MCFSKDPYIYMHVYIHIEISFEELVDMIIATPEADVEFKFKGLLLAEFFFAQGTLTLVIFSLLLIG
jgi:hypothetical protein